MAPISLVAQWFFYCLAGGSFLFSFITPSHLTGAGFMRLVTGVSLGSYLGYLVMFYGRNEFSVLNSLLHLWLAFLWVAFYFWHQDHKTKLTWAIYLISSLLAIVLPLLVSDQTWFDYSYLISSLLLIGITNYAMVLGHYYLVVPKLSERPLIVSLYWLWAILGIKFLWGLYSCYDQANFFTSGTQLGQGYIFNWMMGLMRFLWGYVALGILSYFAYRLCRIRSIQSATGVFYIMVFFVFIGEIIAYFYAFGYGLYL